MLKCDLRMRKLFIVVCLSFIIQGLKGQDSTKIFCRDYPFIIQDYPNNLFSMRQFNQNYLSSYRLFNRGMYSVLGEKRVTDYVGLAVSALFFVPLTHEEGHRSILTYKGIGSISQPFFNKNGAAYVVGVRDADLQSLRDNDFPTYIRLHTAGLESDYMLTKRTEELIFMEQESFRYLQIEYLVRKLSILQYYFLGLVKYESNLSEEENELKRDIVGHDLYGAVRHLHRPTMIFQRYTSYDEMTSEEKRYIKRIGYLSFFNLVSPFIIGKDHIYKNENTKINVSLGYTMAPFGDFIDENFFVKYGDLNFTGYLRQAFNKNSLFWGFGIGLVNYSITKNLIGDVKFDIWQQPKNFHFITSSYFLGGSIDLGLKYSLFTTENKVFKGISFDLGFLYKTRGFLPEDVALTERFGLRIGTTISI